MTYVDLPNAKFPCCCLRMLCFPMSLFWLQATIDIPLRVSANEVRVWEQAKLKCLDRCGSGAQWCSIVWGFGGGGGKSGSEGHCPNRNSVPKPSLSGGGLVMEDSVIFSITYAASSFMHKHPNGVRLTPVCAMRRARVYQNNEKEGMKISSALTCLSVSCLTKIKNSPISQQCPLYYFLGPPRPSEIHCQGDTPLSLALIPSTNLYGSHTRELYQSSLNIKVTNFALSLIISWVQQIL